VRVGPETAEDFIQALPEPAVIPAGEVFRFLVTYSALADRDLHVDLLDANTNFVAGTVQRVGASSGAQELTISHPEAAPGTYFVNSFLTEPGQTWTESLAWSAIRQVTVLPSSYLEWAAWRWGLLLANDAYLPTDDADGDGASNDAERIGHTAPLDAADVLRLNTSIIGQQLVLSWPSRSVRQYQLFERRALTSETWTPLGATVGGSGGTVQQAIGLPEGSAQRFYRLQVSEP
jgi:hypothetical protein